MAYKLIFAREIDFFHEVFYVSILRQYRSDPSHIIQKPEIEVSKKNLNLRMWKN